MIRNFKIALRTLIKHWLFSTINILSMAIAIAVSMIIVFYLKDQLSYDKHHKNGDQIYRLTDKLLFKNEFVNSPAVPGVYASFLKESLPEIKETVRFRRNWNKVIVEYQGNKYYEASGSVAFADSTVLKLFDIPILDYEDPRIFSGPERQVVINREIANKYFGGSRATGKLIKIDGKDYKVKGIIDSKGKKSHLDFNFLLVNGLTNDEMDWEWVYCYVLLNPEVDPDNFKNKSHRAIRAKFSENADYNNIQKFELDIQPLKSIHLNSNLAYEWQKNGSQDQLYILGSLALLIIFVAAVNFINLTTALGHSRRNEIGTKKILGASKFSLAAQSLYESFINCVAGAVIGFCLIQIFFPLIKTQIGLTFDFNEIPTVEIIFLLVIYCLITTILSGVYPAIFLSSLKSELILDKNSNGLGKGKIRNVLTGIQFMVAFILICSTVTIYKQFDFFISRDNGYKTEKIIAVEASNDVVRERFNGFKQNLLQMSQIEGLSYLSNMPGNDNIPLFPYQAHSNTNASLLQAFFADEEMISTFDISIINGRNFRLGKVDDKSILVNQKAVKSLGWDEPLGKWLELFGERYTVIGVVNDFTFVSLHDKVSPLIIHKADPYNLRSVVAVKLSTDNLAVINEIQERWKSHFPDIPFEYTWHRDDLSILYESERTTGKLIGSFSLLAILISLVGLFGLTAFVIQSQMKAISIRKVLGSSFTNILAVLGSKILKPIFISLIVSLPMAYILMDKWLQKFAFRIDIPWMAITIGSITLLIASTLVLLAYGNKATRTNPIEYLHED